MIDVHTYPGTSSTEFSILVLHTQSLRLSEVICQSLEF
jgi:hypothetical protein